MAKSSSLTAKQDRFCQEYVIDLNGTQAAIRAGYSQKTAQEQASRLLSYAIVQERIVQLKSERIKRTQLDADFTLKRLAWLADSNLKRIASWGTKTVTRYPKHAEGESYDEEVPFMVVRSSDELTKAQAYGIDSIKVKATEFGPEISIKMRSPGQALDILARHQGLLEGVPQKAGEDLSDALAALDHEEQDVKKDS